MLAYGSLAWLGRRASTRSNTSRSDTIPLYSSASSNRMLEMVGSDCSMVPLLLMDLDHSQLRVPKRLPCVARPPACAQLRVDQLGQQLQAIHDSRARAAEIGIAVHCIDPPPTPRGQRRPAVAAWQPLCSLLDRSAQVEPAWRHDNH